jgi:hypothetical protein
MIIIPSKKFIYLRVPKTGSTSVSQYLNEKFINIEDLTGTPIYHTGFKRSGMIDKKELVHASTKEIVRDGIVSSSDISSYKIFAIIRDPVERFISHCYFTKNNRTGIFVKDGVNNIVSFFLEELESDLDAFRRGNLFHAMTAHPQSRWLIYNDVPISNIYSYEHINRLTSEALTYVGINDIGVNPYRYRSDFRQDKKVSLDPDLTRQIISYYHDDYVMYNEIRNKEKDME